MSEEYDAVVVGAGFSGLYLLHRLRALGLRVRVAWRHNGHQQPGTVVSVQPAGRLPAGTTIVVTGALAPPGHGDGQGTGGNGHGGGGPGD